jgi:hypothetical protein
MGTFLPEAATRKEAKMVYDVPLSMKEIELMRFIIERYRKAMLFEIANTDSGDLKGYLRGREELLEALVYKLDSFSGDAGETELLD